MFWKYDLIVEHFQRSLYLGFLLFTRGDVVLGQNNVNYWNNMSLLTKRRTHVCVCSVFLQVPMLYTIPIESLVTVTTVPLTLSSS